MANLATSDDARATCPAGADNGALSTFGFSIPAAATIAGIEVEVEGSDGTGATVTYAVQLSWDNGLTWTALHSSTFTGTADTTSVLGGLGDTWGRAWTVAELADANFRLRIRRTAGGSLRIDRIRVNAHYTLATATTALYRSVGISAANLNTGARTVQIAGSTATFSGPMPANVGVGDVLQYQVAATWYLAFVSARTSDTVYTVRSATGAAPQAAAAGTAVGVYRAYTSLFNWESQNENPALDVSVRNFDTSTDLVTPNAVMNVACYADGADATAVVVSGWATAATNYIRIYTPVTPAEVGVSQRHPGRWDTTKYRLEANFEVLRISDRYARVDGLQLRLTVDVGNVGVIVFTRASDTGVSYYEASNNIVRGNGAGAQPIRIGINLYNAGSGVVKVWNNVVYDFRGGGAWVGGIIPDDPAYTHYLYNNTVVDCEEGIDALQGTVVAKNNLAYGNVDNYLTGTGVFEASSTNNLSGPVQADAPGSNPRNAATVSFVNAAGDDFHLGAADTGARGQGADLSADPGLAFAVDVDGGPRAALWDIGADEIEAVTQGHYRWRNDDGSETTATWAAAEDAPLVNVPRMDLRRVRFEVSNQGAVATGAVEYRLQAAQSASCATASYTTVPVDYLGPAWDWEVTDSWNFSDGDPTTNAAGVTDEAATFVAGQMKDAGNYTLGGITLAANQFTEIEFAVRATASAVAGANYCFRLYDATNNRPLDAYTAYAQATAYDRTLTLSNHLSGQFPDQLGGTTPATITAFRFRLSRVLTVTVDTLRLGFTTGGGIANADVTAGELWEDTNGNGTFDGAGPDTLVQGGVTPTGGVLTFTTNFTPAASGTNYFVRATIANLTTGDTTTFSLAAADIDEVEAGVVEAGSIAGATHTQDPPTTDVYYSIGTSVADLKTGTPSVAIAAGVATFTTAQTGNVGVGDRIDYGAATPVYIRSVLSRTRFVVHGPQGAVPADGGGAVASITRAFNSIGTAVTGSVDVNHLTNGNLVGTGRKLTWVCYNDGPLNVATETTIAGYTTDAYRYITLTVAGASQVASGLSQRHTGRAGTGARIEVTASLPGGGVVLTVDEAYTHVEWLEIDGNDFTGNTGIDVPDPGGTGSLLQYLLIHDVENTPPTGQSDGFGLSLGADNVTVRNSIVYEYGEDGIYASGTGIRVENSTFYRSTNTPNVGEAIQVASGGSLTAENVIATDSQFYHDAGGTFVCNNSLSSDGSANDAAFGCSGSGNLVNRSAASLFVSLTGTIDLHLRYGAAASNTGKDLSASLSDDIDGQARPQGPAWDIGADEAGAQMLVKSGTYMGNGTSQSITGIGFQPDLVIVSADSTNAGVGITFPSGHTDVLRTSTMTGNVSKAAYVYNNHPLVNRVTSLDASGFSVGHPADHLAPNDNTGDPYHCVNHSAVRYYWVAFKAAPGEMAVGTYTGNGALAQDVTTVGFQPDYTMVLPDNGDDVVHRFALQPVDYSLDFDGGSQCPGGCSRNPEAGIRTELPTGFRVGQYVNTNATTYHYVAWKATPGRIAVGQYSGTGDGSNCGTAVCGDNRSIGGLGFRPEMVQIANGLTPVPNSSTTYKTASTGSSNDYSLVYISYNAGYQGADDIQALEADGFQIGTGNNVNGAGEPHYWAAFGPGLPTSAVTNYRSIGTAANYTTGQVQVTNGSAAVVGLGTQWATANRGRGDFITITGQGTYAVLRVVSENSLVLTAPFSGTSGSYGYTIGRQHTTLLSWYQCITNQVACPYFDAPSASLVADDRREVGIAYDETSFTLGAPLLMDDATTNPTHDIVLTADPGNRHTGTAGTGVVVVAPAAQPAFQVKDNDVTIEWLEISGGGSAVNVQTPWSGLGHLVLRNNLLRAFTADAVLFTGTNDADIYNNVITSALDGIDLGGFSSKAKLYNNTIYGNSGFGITGCSNPDPTLRNNIVMVNGSGDIGCTGRAAASSHNITVNGSGPINSPAGGGIGFATATDNPLVCGGTCVGFVSLPSGTRNLHLLSTSYANVAVDAGANLSTVFTLDIDDQLRPAAWDMGADERDATTAVRLHSLLARPFSGAVRVEWETASELDNLGFHLYRGLSASGPWTRLNATLVSGLGTSPTGRAYSWLDAGLTNGVRYFYRLEDVDTRSKVTSHGPVWALPDASLADPTAGQRETETSGRESGSSGDEATQAAESCPAWVAAAYGERAPSGSGAPRCTRHGEPESVSLRELQHSVRGAELELRTDGFWAVHEADGSVRLFVSGFDTPEDPSAPALPLRRALVEAVAGRTVELVTAEPRELVAFRGLVPAAVGVAEIEATRQGAMRGARRAVRPVRFGKGYLPQQLARLVDSVFQGETKSAVLELTPLRYDGARGELVLARRLRVRLSFAGRDLTETSRGHLGRKPPRPRPSPVAYELLAQLHTSRRGLHAVSFEQLFPAGRAPVPRGELSLRLSGAAVAFHVEPAGQGFGPGSVLYFHSSRVAASTDYAAEIAWELVRAEGGLLPEAASAAPVGGAAGAPEGRSAFETNRFYSPGLADAPDVWLWDFLASGALITESFALADLDPASARGAAITLHLQGASESGQAVDHHLAVSLAGVPLGELRFAGKRAFSASFPVPAGLLQSAANSLEIRNVPDTGVQSAVFLDRFELDYPRLAALAQGVFEGRFPASGTAELQGVGGPVALLDTTEEPARWLTGFELAAGRVRFFAEAGRRYLAASAEGLLAPRVSPPPAATLRSPQNQADYLLIAPQAFLEAAGPLVERRQAQGLTARAVALEEIAQLFGHGRPSAEAVRDFVAFAFHSWATPSPRYVLLLGDASYDPQGFLATSKPAPLPAFWARTAFMVVPSDPALAAVNGDDTLPDLAIGRLPAGTPDEARALVAKLLAWEDSGQGLGGTAAIVADNPDAAGDFDANARDIAESFLAGRHTRLLRLSELGAPAMRPAIRDAFDAGLSLVSYVGHGGSAVWASENVWNFRDFLSLRPQSQQPLLLTLNCLNGYFVPPAFDSLAESLVKADGRGAIAAFAPAGFSLDGPAHQYHRALMAEITSGRHERLGDAITAAQRAYAQTGLMPELLSLYHLFGDPATRIR